MKINENKYFLGALYIGIVGLGLSIFVFSIQTISLMQKDFSSQSPIVQFKTYFNEKGEQWNLPLGKYQFSVVQAATNEGPIFLEGEIDPPDVHVGDTQWLKVIVQSPVGIKQVTAHIETDTGIKELPLNKVGVVSYREMEPNKYMVENGILEILSSRQAKKLHNQKIAAEKKSIITGVNAQTGDKEKWENFWVVHDTHNTTYKTTFIVEDNAGLTDTLVLAWSDLCEIPTNGNVGGTWKMHEHISECTISAGQLDGIENGDIEIIEGVHLQILNGGTFVFNPNYEIRMEEDKTKIGRAKITLAKNTPVAQIKKTNMWYCDRDGDGRTPDGTIGTILTGLTAPVSACGGGGGGGGGGTFNNLYKRVVNLFNFKTPEAAAELNCGPTGDVWAIRRYIFSEGQIDCYSQSANAYTGATGYCETHRGDGSWDYNCVNGEQKQYEDISSIYCQVSPYPPSTCQKNCGAISGNYGWQSTIPDCGVEGLISNGCEDTNYEGCIKEDPEGGCDAYCSGNYACTESVPRWVSQVQRCR